MRITSRAAAGFCILASIPCVLWAQGQPPPSKQTPPSTVKTEGPKIDTPGVENIGAPVDPKSYVIGAEDVLFISVWREADFTGPKLVRPDGRISLPLIGDLQAGGLTPERLGAQITQALAELLNNPQVTVAVTQVNSKKYYITGEMNRTGAFPLVVPTTVLEALAAAGGFRDFANKKGIVIMRGAQRFKFNYNDVVKGKKLEQNILLQHGDYIHVP